MSPATPMAQAIGFTLAMAARALENKQVASRILELSMPELKKGNTVLVVVPLRWDFILAMFCHTLTLMLTQKACASALLPSVCTCKSQWGGKVYHSPSGHSSNSSSGSHWLPRTWACQPAHVKACSVSLGFFIFLPPCVCWIWEWSTSLREAWEGNFECQAAVSQSSGTKI